MPRVKASNGVYLFNQEIILPESMLIENFITSFARKENARYLQFSAAASLTIPPKQ